MKKILVYLALLAIVFIPMKAIAGFDQGHILLRDYTNIFSLTDFDLTSGGAVFSATIDNQHNAGYAALLIKEDKAGGAGDIDVSVEYSVDGSNWYSVYVTELYANATLDTSTGTIHKSGLIAESLQNTTYWIRYGTDGSRYLRYKFDPDADSRITATHIFVNDE